MSAGDRGDWLPPRAPGSPTIRTVEMHAGGEPLRVVVPGGLGLLEPAPGLPLLTRRRRLLDSPELDAVRRMLMHEPRGHRDMYGAVLVPSELPGAALGALFVHNDGASSMCGHAVLCLGRFAVDYGLCQPPPSPGETTVAIHCPCGPVTAFASWDGQRSGSRVRFHSVPAFAAATDAQVDRSPTGSGVTARIALQYHKGLIQLNQTRTFRSSSTGSLFTGKAIKETKCGDYSAVIVEVSGESFYTGTSTFTLEENDPLKYGFFLK